jgi:thiol-disulfide isomerase/thioredoxin
VMGKDGQGASSQLRVRRFSGASDPSSAHCSGWSIPLWFPPCLSQDPYLSLLAQEWRGMCTLQAELSRYT